MASHTAPGVDVHLVSGTLGDDSRGPAQNHHPIHGLQLRLDPGASYEVRLPAEDRAFLYVRTGGRTGIGPAGTVAWSDPVDGADTSTLRIEAASETDEVTEVVLFSGRPIGEQVVAHGPFVMNSHEEIAQAFQDYRSGTFGPVPRLARVP
jgi:redox-sensitive bicupin YhaK (pirin superfamily)